MYEAGGPYGFLDRDCHARSSIDSGSFHHLLQRVVYRSEIGVELRADALTSGDDADQAMLDRGRAGFIAQQGSNRSHDSN